MSLSILYPHSPTKQRPTSDPRGAADGAFAKGGQTAPNKYVSCARKSQKNNVLMYECELSVTNKFFIRESISVPRDVGSALSACCRT